MPKETAQKEEHYINELKEMLQEGEPKEKVFAVFCQRHGVSLDQCKMYYDKIEKKGTVKKK